MACGRSRAVTVLHTRPKPPEIKRRLLLASQTSAAILEPSSKDFPSSPLLASTRTLTGPDLDANIAPAVHSEEVPYAGHQLFNFEDQDHDNRSKSNELDAMFESPARSWAGSPQTQATTEIKQREVRIAGSASGSPPPEQRPPRQDSAYYSVRGRDEGSEVDIEVQAQQMKARERLGILRGRVDRTRRSMRERKGRLRLLQENVRDALDKLSRTLNELVALGRWQDLQTELSPHYTKLREAQDDLGPAEDDYDQLENRLEEQEQELEEEEDHFYRHNNLLSFLVPESKLDEELSPLVRPYEPSDVDIDDATLENEQVQDYLARVEEAERLKDELDGLETEYYQRTVDANFRRRQGFPLSQETTEFLQDYPNLYRETLRTLHTVEDIVFDLRDDCLKNHLFSENEYSYEPRDALYEDVMDSVYEARERSPMRVASEKRSEKLSELEVNFGNKREYINKWLMEWVQDSTLGTMMLQAWIYFEFPDMAHKAQKLDENQWTELALDKWDTDGAGELATHLFNASRLDAITGETADTGNLGTFATTRSGEDFRSDSAVVQNGEASSAGREPSSTITQQPDPDLTPTKQLSKPSSSKETTPKALQGKHPLLFAPKPAIFKTTSLHGFLINTESPIRAIHPTIEVPRRAKSADYRGRQIPALQLQNASVHTDGSTVRDDASSAADPSTPFDIQESSADTFDYDQPHGDHFLLDNTDFLSDLCISLNDVLS